MLRGGTYDLCPLYCAVTSGSACSVGWTGMVTSDLCPYCVTNGSWC